jgi:hypothetical protein
MPARSMMTALGLPTQGMASNLCRVARVLVFVLGLGIAQGADPVLKTSNRGLVRIHDLMHACSENQS